MKIVISESQLESILFKKLLNESSTSATLFGGGIQPKTISTPEDHKKRPLGNWASDDAWDFKAPIGTSVHALTKGKVSKVYQSSGKKKSIYGTQISITGTDGYPNIFYTHLDNVNLQKGDVVEPGDYIGKITRWDAHPESSHVHIGIHNKKDAYNFMGRDGKIKDVDPNKANMEIGGLDIKGEGGILGLLKNLFQKGSTDKPLEGVGLDKLLTLILTSIGIPLTGMPKGSFNLKDKLKSLNLKKEYNFKSDSNRVSPSKLLNDLDSKLNNTNLAKGLVANAKGESGFNVLAKGDGGNYANKDAEKKRRNVGGYCSFGLWQYNICGGLGNSLLKYYDVDVDTASDKEKMEVLEDYDKQVSFMVNHIKQKGVANDNKTVKEWIKWIVDEVERPANKAAATAKRIEYAKDLGYV